MVTNRKSNLFSLNDAIVGLKRYPSGVKINEATSRGSRLVYLVIRQLQRNSLIGAYVCAATALDAGISVNNVNIPSRDSLYGALANAATTSYTFVGINFVSHNLYLLKKFKCVFCLFGNAKIYKKCYPAPSLAILFYTNPTKEVGSRALFYLPAIRSKPK